MQGIDINSAEFSVWPHRNPNTNLYHWDDDILQEPAKFHILHAQTTCLYDKTNIYHVAKSSYY